VTFGKVGGIVRESATAAKTLYSFVRMPQAKHGSRKAIEHWRGFRSSPLDQNPQTANLGGRVHKIRMRERRWGQPYVDEGAKAYETRYRQQRIGRLAATAKELGYELAPISA
jgi:hypothetical protein